MRELSPEEIKSVERGRQELQAKQREEAEQRKLSAEKQAARETGAKVMLGLDGESMVLVPAGEFTMGTSGDRDSLLGLFKDGQDNERPAHKIYVDGFYLDYHEVTVKQYAEFIAAVGHQPPSFWSDAKVDRDGNRPIVGVTWNDADAYCRWIGKRLPTEAEWEKAARGTDERRYPWGNTKPTAETAWFGKERKWMGYTGLAPVGTHEKGASPYQAEDMAGNVWEWVADWYDPDYYKQSPSKNPTGPRTGAQRVIRGGGYSAGDDLRSTFRYGLEPATQAEDTGFRCVEAVK
jgi:formylglycine-generating enzyme required for sulfatase activity